MAIECQFSNNKYHLLLRSVSCRNVYCWEYRYFIKESSSLKCLVAYELSFLKSNTEDHEFVGRGTWIAQEILNYPYNYLIQFMQYSLNSHC